jgi:hypothetical protein
VIATVADVTHQHPGSSDIDNRPEVAQLWQKLQEQLPELKKLLDTVDGHWGGEDAVYRFYHGSFKVYHLQELTGKIVAHLSSLLPGRPLNDWFKGIIEQGTGKTFKPEDNTNWLTVTRPILEAFFHARYFLEMAVKYASSMPAPPLLMPSGWAAFLYLYNLR